MRFGVEAGAIRTGALFRIALGFCAESAEYVHSRMARLRMIGVECLSIAGSPIWYENA